MSDDETYRILQTEEEIRREALNKVVECSILRDRIASLENDISNLRYLIELLDETAPSKDECGRVDILPVYREIRARIMAIMCKQKEMEERICVLKEDIDSTGAMSNMKVVIKRL